MEHRQSSVLILTMPAYHSGDKVEELLKEIGGCVPTRIENLNIFSSLWRR